MSQLVLYNTLSRREEPFQPLEPGKVRLYVCGMTVYDYCHIGHARAMVTFDVVVRWLRERGLEVRYVRNHTDVDDKIILRALELGEDPLALSRRFIAALDEDLDRLGLLRPDVEPKVSEHIGPIIAMIQRLIDRGHAYAVEGDVWFSVESFPRYGQLSGKRLEELRAGERIAVDERKRHPGDFALWKASKPGEVSWPSPWGPGRPGWHIECSAMSAEHLGERFDIHGGGIDLVFPHHENEIAQSECSSGQHPMAQTWMHNGHLTLVDEQGDAIKMSKSLGNVIRIRDLLDEAPAEALRLVYLDGHYRKPLPYGPSRLQDALGAVERVYLARQAMEAVAATGEGRPPQALADEQQGDTAELWAAVQAFPAQFAEAMDDDINTARALSALFELSRLANRFANQRKRWKGAGPLAQQALAAFDLAGRVLGIGGRDSATFFAELTEKLLRRRGLRRADIEQRVQARQRAREARDWAVADALREELEQLGVVVMDGPEGSTWRLRVA